MSLLCHSWTCPRCGKTWISAVGSIKGCERCGLSKLKAYQAHWHELDKRRRFDDAA